MDGQGEVSGADPAVHSGGVADEAAGATPVPGIGATPVPEQPDQVLTDAPAPVPPPVVDEAGLDALFRTARTSWTWRDEGVDDDTLRRLYGLLKWAPTSGNCSPARFLFLRTEGAKRRLRPALSVGNADKAVAAPVVAIVAYDPKFDEDLPRLYPGVDARAWFAGNDVLAEETAFRNGTLQGAYLMMVARAVGLDCGPMSGFDNEKVDREFLVAQGWKSNFLLSLGHADKSKAGPRLPRLSFDEACRLL